MNSSTRLTGLALVVDDSSEALSLVHDTLEAAGMDVLVALEGKQALKIAQRMKPDIILLDGNMPIMDGFETCKRLKECADFASTPIIFMTGLSETEDVVRGFAVGGVDYLTKPIKPAEMVARIRVHMDNAKITRSAYSALDVSGQNLFSVNEQGMQGWATPQAVTLLAKAKVDSADGWGKVASSLHYWLKHSPAVGQTLMLDDLTHKLSIKIVSIHSNEWVLKLIDEERPQGAALLKDALNLTERESDVIFWIANGKTNREAAEILEMSPRTVNKHLEQIFTKLSVDNRTSAAGVALKILAREELSL